MKNFKTKTLVAALAGFSTDWRGRCCGGGLHQPDGLGQVLIYPYYTVRGKGPDAAAKFDTYMSVVNTTDSAKAVKVRYIEGKTARKCLTSTCSCRPKTSGWPV